MSEPSPSILLCESGLVLSPAQHTAIAARHEQIVLCTTIAEAVAVLPAHRPALLVLCERRQAPSLPILLEVINGASLATRVLVITPRPTVRAAISALQLGACEFISSQTTPVALRILLHRLLDSFPAAPSRTPPAESHDQPDVYQNLCERLRTQDEFIALISHELRTPLMTINGYLELLKKYHDQLSAEKSIEFINRALQATGEAAHLTDMLMQITQCETGHMAVSCENVALLPIVRAVVAQFDMLATYHTIVTTIAPSLMLHTDEQALRHILSNLLSNAIKYAPQGGTIRLHARSQSDAMVVITVSDEGIGIAPDQLPQLFTRFTRVHDQGQWPGIHGTGLGLYICRQLATAIGARIWATSTLGQGSTFSIAIPKGIVPTTVTTLPGKACHEPVSANL